MFLGRFWLGGARRSVQAAARLPHAGPEVRRRARAGGAERGWRRGLRLKTASLGKTCVRLTLVKSSLCSGWRD